MTTVDGIPVVVGQPALAAARDHGDVLRYLAAACITQQDQESECELATDVSFIHKIKVTSSTTALLQ